MWCVCGSLVLWIFVNHCQVFASMWRLTVCWSCQRFAVASWHSSSGSIVLRCCGQGSPWLLQHQPKWYSFAKQANRGWSSAPKKWHLNEPSQIMEDGFHVFLCKPMIFCGIIIIVNCINATSAFLDNVDTGLINPLPPYTRRSRRFSIDFEVTNPPK